MYFAFKWFSVISVVYLIGVYTGVYLIPSIKKVTDVGPVCIENPKEYINPMHWTLDFDIANLNPESDLCYALIGFALTFFLYIKIIYSRRHIPRRTIVFIDGENTGYFLRNAHRWILRYGTNNTFYRLIRRAIAELVDDTTVDEIRIYLCRELKLDNAFLSDMTEDPTTKVTAVYHMNREFVRVNDDMVWRGADDRTLLQDAMREKRAGHRVKIVSNDRFRDQNLRFLDVIINNLWRPIFYTEVIEDPVIEDFRFRMEPVPYRNPHL